MYRGNFVTRKRTAIILVKLARESASKLESMVTELAGDAKPCASGLTPHHWGRRFVASGKTVAYGIRP